MLHATNTIRQAVIVAAGHGASLGPLTQDRPKAMLPVLGKPIIIRLMDRLREAGIGYFVVVVDEHEGGIASYLNSSWAPNVRVKIVIQPSPRGTADALRCAASAIYGPFLLATCDTLVPTEHIPALMRRFQEFDGDMVLSVVPATSEQAADLPTILADGQRVTGISERKQRSRRDLAALTVSACGKRILNYLDDPSRGPQHNDQSMITAVRGLIAAGGKVSYLSAVWHMRLASELDLLAINKRFLREDRDTHILSELPGSVQVMPPVRIDPQVSVGQGAKIGPNVYLESGSYVGHDAVIWDSMVLRNAAVANGEVVHGQIVSVQARLSENPVTTGTEPTEPPYFP
jgi:NDP-sugar pyrophosphorylase family protein